MPATFHPMPGQALSIAFHNGDNFPESMTTPAMARMVAPRLLAGGVTIPMENLKPVGATLVADVKVADGVTGSMVAALSTRPNFIELDAAKFEGYLKHEGLEHVIEWRKRNQEAAAPGRERYSKYVKSLLQIGRGTKFAAAGFPIEMHPLANPYELQVGDLLPVKIEVRGKPVGGLQVEAAWLDASGKAHRTIVGRTDVNGAINVRLGAKGTWKLHTVFMERCADSAVADWESLWASMTFAVENAALKE
jgi:uncharacterized GH25 family protein